jgi:hypothetical protein
MAAGSIVIDLLMRTGSFETDTKRAQARLKELEKEARQVGAAIGTAFAAAAVATAYFVKSTIDAADKAGETAQAVGLTVEAYTSLAFAAQMSGSTQEDLATALTRLAVKAADAAGGSATAGAAFTALGIDIRDAGGAVKDTDRLLVEIADKFRGYADGAEKTALAVDLFGRTGAKLIPLLNAGARGIADLRNEAPALGLVLDTETAVAAGEFNDGLDRLGATVRGLGNSIAREALPALNDFNALMLDLAKSQEAMNLVTGVANFALKAMLVTFQALVVLGSDVAFVLLGVGREIGAIAAQAAALARLDLNGFRAISDAVKQDGERARAELDKFQARVMALGSPGAAAGLTGRRLDASTDPRSLTFGQAAPRAPTLPSGGGGGSASTAAVDRAAQYLESLRKQLQGTKDLSVEEALLADIQAGRLGKVLPAQEAELRGIARQIDAAKASETAMQAAMRAAQERSDARKREDEEITAAIVAAQEADRSRLESLTAGTYTKQLQQVTADVQFLNRAYAAGAVDVQTWAEAVTQATGRLKQQGEEMDSFAKTMAENVQTFLGSAFADAMDGNFKSIGSAFTQMVNRMVAEALAADLSRRLFGASSGGSGEGWIGAAISAIGGYFGGGKAGGGDVMPGREYWVGENGPERFVPRTMGTIMPAGSASATGQQAMVVHNSFTVSGPVDRRTEAQIAAAAGRGLQRAAARLG